MKSSTFKFAVRLVLFLLAIGAILLVAHLQDLGDQYGVVDYFTFSVSNLRADRPSHSNTIGNIVGDKIIVMAKMETEDTSWVAEELPEYVELNPVHVANSRTNICLAGNGQFTLSILPRGLQTSSPPVSTKATNPWLT
jgi:hypothetical protein